MQVSRPKTSNENEILEHINNFSYDLIKLPKFDDQFFRNIIDAPIGGGSFGSVYVLDPETVFKITSPCLSNAQNISKIHRNYLQRLCNMIRGKIYYQILNENRKLLILPDDINDGVIGIILNQISDYTPHFGNTVSVFFSPSRGQVYTTARRLDSLNAVIQSADDLYILFFQVTQALMVAQRTIRFTHHDLHIGNILYDASQSDYIVYDTESGRLSVLAPFIAKIIDFGMSSCTYKNMDINSVGINLPVYHGGAFIPGYDLLVLFGSIFIGNYFGRNYKNFLSDDERLELLQILTANYDMDYNLLIQKTYSVLNSILYYRPKGVEGLYYHNYPSTEYVLERLTEILIRRNLATYTPIYAQYGQPAATKLETQAINFPKIAEYCVDAIPYGFYQDELMMIVQDIDTNYVYINRQRLKSSDLRLISDSGKIDPAQYLVGKTGAIINGGFFDNLNSYNAIGDYKRLLADMTYYESHQDISEVYREYMAYVNIYQNDISFNVQAEVSDYMFQTGPVLIASYNAIFTAQLSETVKTINGHSTKIFKSIVSDSDDYVVHSGIGMTYVINAKKRTQDDMSDALEYTDRSVLALTDDSIILANFKYKNLLQVTEILMNLGVQHAVALGSGIVSNLCWTENGYNIYSTKQNQEYQLVGNVVALVK